MARIISETNGKINFFVQHKSEGRGWKCKIVRSRHAQGSNFRSGLRMYGELLGRIRDSAGKCEMLVKGVV